MTGGSGAGNVTVVVDPPKGTACYMINVAGLDAVTAAHIHTGGPGETGGPVVTLEAPEAAPAAAARKSRPKSRRRCWPTPAATTSTSTPAPSPAARSAGS